MSGAKEERSYLPSISEPGKTGGADIVIPVYYDEQELALFPLDYSARLLKAHKEFRGSSEKLRVRYEAEMGEQYSVLEKYCSGLGEKGKLDPKPGIIHRLGHSVRSSHSDDMRNLEHEVIMPTERTTAQIKSVLDLLKEGISYLETHIADEGLSDEVRSNLAANKDLAEEIRAIYKSMKATTSKTIKLAQEWYKRIEEHGR